MVVELGGGGGRLPRSVIFLGNPLHSDTAIRMTHIGITARAMSRHAEDKHQCIHVAAMRAFEDCLSVSLL